MSAFHKRRDGISIRQRYQSPEKELYRNKTDRFAELVEGSEKLPENEGHHKQEQREGKAALCDAGRPCRTDPTIQVSVSDSKDDDSKDYRKGTIYHQG